MAEVKVPEDQEVVYGGPYMQESEAIEAELLHAHNENREPDLWAIFKGKQISQGGVNLIKTHLEGHPNAGYAGERPSGENFVIPTPYYVTPGDGGNNGVDIETAPVEAPAPVPAPVEEPPATAVVEAAPVSEEPKYDSVIAAAEASVEESPYVESPGKHAAPVAEGEQV